jgi:hypothetical protein
MGTLLGFIVKEFKNPFRDPRAYRKHCEIEGDKLLRLLIDETPETFQVGTIVTATVQRFLSGSSAPAKVICRLENDLEGEIDKANLTDDSTLKLEALLQVGQSIAARVKKIWTDKGPGGFKVSLDCNQQSLTSHKHYVPEQYRQDYGDKNLPEEDLVNHSF